MKELLLALILLITLSNCKEKENFQNDKELCKLLVKMHESDQSIRGLPEIKKSQFPAILDSLKKAHKLTQKEYFNLPEKERKNIAQHAMKISAMEIKNSNKFRDSLWEIQSEIDIKNTRILIEIIKKRGWVNKAQLGCVEYIAPALIFMHSPKENWNEIQTLINKEYSENRMGKDAYNLINSHINGKRLNWKPFNKID
ncbi:hypothetical protein [Robertkochia sediminum]|uniref:hypothetical protein n=1 Tax=Robertkochia sediminum TaxID=2785326 RepID=UPI0019336F46|nr:hypothetical protein [Robertkochia sediminum]MBL7472078.1 hypothetical protein [Robertkochia sediminum]